MDGGSRLSFEGKWFVDSKDIFTDPKNSEDRQLRFFNELEQLKLKAQEDRKKEIYYKLNDGNKITEAWRVLPQGMGQGVHCSWCLERSGVKIGIHSNPEAENIPAILVEFNYKALRNRRFEDVVADVRYILQRMGFTITKESLSRVDLQLTLVLPFRQVAQSIMNRCYVTRAKSFSINGKDGLSFKDYYFLDSQEDNSNTPFETFTFGKRGSVLLRIYDKVKEVLSKADSLKWQDICNRIGPRIDLTRVEFEIHRSWLHDHCIDTVDDFAKHKPEIIEYLTNDFFRVLDSPADKNSCRASVALWWLDVQSKFLRGFDATFQGQELKRCETMPRSFDQFVKQALGCLKSAYVHLPDKKIMDFQEFNQAVIETVKSQIVSLYDSYKEQRKAYLADFEPLTYQKGKFNDLAVIGYRDKVQNAKEEQAKKNQITVCGGQSENSLPKFHGDPED